jgi:hypothetical protein
MLLAKELIDLKASAAYDPLVNGVIQYHRNFFIQNNPSRKGLDSVAQKLRWTSPRKAEMQQELTRFTPRISPSRAQDALAFLRRRSAGN